MAAPTEIDTDQISTTNRNRVRVWRGAALTGDRLVLALVVLFLFCDLVVILRAAASNPLWMDEVLAVWVARLPSAAAIYSALAHGAEFSPPTYHLLLHYLSAVAGDSYLVYRLLSVFAHIVTGICLFTLLRRYLDISSAAFGVTFALLGFLPFFALQARPYALLVACFALATLLWDDLDRTGISFWRVAGIALLLAFTGSLHFYAALFVVCLGSMELVWSMLHARVRPAVWIALIVSGLCSLAWLPLLRTLSRFNAGDTWGSSYYARPKISALGFVYMKLFLFSGQHVLFLLSTIVLLGAAYALSGSRGLKASSFRVAAGPTEKSRTNLYVIAFCEVVFPLCIFIVARLVTKTFNDRYCLIGCLGFSILAACVVSHLSTIRIIGPFMVLIACSMTLMDIPSFGERADYLQPMLARTDRSLPVVIGEGLQFLQLEESAPPATRSRFVYVTAPAGVVSPDPTNENQVKRWIPIRPDLPITDAATFFARYPRFYILHTGISTDVMTDWLASKGLLDRVVARQGGAWLFEARSPNPE
ncbi:MAG: hypothetical protein JO108_34590 [Acidobacteriaceae bacterium]|nr:hypothetical protein [Acidobacteriaceae bacterium]